MKQLNHRADTELQRWHYHVTSVCNWWRLQIWAAAAEIFSVVIDLHPTEINLSIPSIVLSGRHWGKNHHLHALPLTLRSFVLCIKLCMSYTQLQCKARIESIIQYSTKKVNFTLMFLFFSPVIPGKTKLPYFGWKSASPITCIYFWWFRYSKLMRIFAINLWSAKTWFPAYNSSCSILHSFQAIHTILT